MGTATKRRYKTAVATGAAGDPACGPLPPDGARPLRWGPPWPSVDARLHISGVHGVWAFYGGVEYGRQRYIEIVPWEARKGPRGTLWRSQEFAQLTRYVAPLERVFVLADGVGKGAQ